MSGIVDAHHHIWRQADLPWLMGPMQPRIFGSYEPIRRDYAIGEYLDDVSGCGVTRSVYVQTNWAKERFEDEAAWVQQTANETGYPHAIIAYADMDVEDVRPQLDRLSRYKLVRGVRMQLHWHENPHYRPSGPICLPSGGSAPTSHVWPTMDSVSTCRCLLARWLPPQNLPRTVRPSSSSCNMRECWRTCRRRAAAPGEKA
jgi:hypothetical protein